MKKSIITFLAFIAFVNSYSQSNSETLATNRQAFTSVNPIGKQVYGTSFFFVNPKKDIKGSTFLFDDWKNNGLFVTEDDKKFKIANINVNLLSNNFQAKTKGDSLYSFNHENIKRVVIKNKSYKAFVFNDDFKIFQIVFESQNLSILKGYDVEISAGSPNPMVNRPSSKYVRSSDYYVMKDKKIKRFKLRKKKLLSLFDKDKVSLIQDYVKENNLSYKKEKDVVKLLIKFSN